jgi:hypothetical protein
MGQGPSHLTKIPINSPGSNTMNPADFGFTTETIKVEHVLTIHLGDKWDRPIRKLSESLARLGSHWAESFRIIAVGLSAYFVLSGLAKLVAATKSTDSDSSSNINSKDRSARPTRSSKRSKDKRTTSADKSVVSEMAFNMLSDQEPILGETEGAAAHEGTEI